MEQNKNAVAKEETEKVQKTTKQTSAKKPVVEKAQAPEKPQPDIEKLLAVQREEFEKRLAEQQKEFEERLAAQTRAYMASSGSDQVTLLYMGLSMRGSHWGAWARKAAAMVSARQTKMPAFQTKAPVAR